MGPKREVRAYRSAARGRSIDGLTLNAGRVQAVRAVEISPTQMACAAGLAHTPEAHDLPASVALTLENIHAGNSTEVVGLVSPCRTVSVQGTSRTTATLLQTLISLRVKRIAVSCSCGRPTIA